MDKITRVAFRPGETSAKISGLWMYDYGQQLEIHGLSLPREVAVEYSLNGQEPTVDRIGYTTDGVTTVAVPDSVLSDSGDLKVYIRVLTEESGQTEYTIRGSVKHREKPAIQPEPGEENIFGEAIRLTSEAADRAEDAEKSAEGWAHGHVDYPERDEDNARYYAGKAEENEKSAYDYMMDTQRLASQAHSDADIANKNAKLAEQYKTQAAQSEANALLSEQASKASETAAQEAQAAAEEIIADREQIEKNTQGITELKGDISQISSTVINDKFGDYYAVPLTFENTYLLDTGETSNYDEANTSNYVSVVPGETIIVSAQYGYHTKSVCFYNANRIKTYVYPENRVEAIENYDEREFKVPDGSYYVRVCSCFTTLFPVLKKKNNEKAYEEVKNTANALQNEMKSPYYEYQKYDVSIVDGFIVKGNGNVSEYGTSKVTDFIEMIPDDAFYITADAQYQSAVIGLYDSSNAKVATFGYNADTSYYVWNDELNISTLLKQYPTAKYFRVSSLNGDKLSVQIKVTSSVWDVIARTKESNVLYGKKYVACGDSFTHATNLANYVDEDGNTGTESKAYDKNMSMYKSYAWWIAHRNEMTLINEAHDGSMMHSINNSVLCFSEERYKLIPKDADYITLAFGLNDDLPQDNVVYGDKTSTDITTIWGAWNTVLEYLITNIPEAKIGIIINDGWMSEKMRNTEIEIAEYWGIPYLDLAGGENIPLMIGGKVGSTVSEKAKALRTSQYSTSENNQHPNYDAHMMRSTIIEAWMRSMDGCGHAKHNGNGESSGSYDDTELRKLINGKAGKDEIPTDAHINDLIDSKLGVIENGTY